MPLFFTNTAGVSLQRSLLPNVAPKVKRNTYVSKKRILGYRRYTYYCSTNPRFFLKSNPHSDESHVMPFGVTLALDNKYQTINSKKNDSVPIA